MNEVLRLFDHFLKKHGYAIKEHTEYNLLPLDNFEGFAEQKKVYTSFNSNTNSVPDNVEQLEICLRTCINHKRAKGTRSELSGVGLEEHLLRCICSLIHSSNQAIQEGARISFTVFDDHSDKSMLDKIQILCRHLKCPWRIMPTENTGQGASLHQHFAYAKNKQALFYFCEDDYLYEPSAIHEMINFYKKVYKQTGTHLLIYPQEHELLYSRYNYPSYILLGENRRWRTISHTTHTFFTHSSVVKDYWGYFENTKFVGIRKKRHLGSERRTTDQLFQHIPGFSPIPAVAVHFQSEACLPPFFNWQALWDNLQDQCAGTLQTEDDVG